MTLLIKKCDPQMLLCLFMFRPIMLKQLNNFDYNRHVQLSWLARGYAPDCDARGPGFTSRL